MEVRFVQADGWLFLLGRYRRNYFQSVCFLMISRISFHKNPAKCSGVDLTADKYIQGDTFRP